MRRRERMGLREKERMGGREIMGGSEREWEGERRKPRWERERACARDETLCS